MTPSEQNDSPRQFRVRVEASGYAVVLGRTKKEATEKARAGKFVRTPHPEWYARVSSLEETEWHPLGSSS